jgi:hypothetical protein
MPSMSIDCGILKIKEIKEIKKNQRNQRIEVDKPLSESAHT